MSNPPRPPMMHPMQGGGPPGGPIRPPGYPVMGPRPPGQMVSSHNNDIIFLSNH